MPESNPTTPAPQKPADQAALVGLTKRQQLKKTNQNIFIWVAAAAVVLAFSIVALQFLVRQGLFNNKIISEQQKTNRTLEESISNFDGLKRNVDALLADTKLSALRANPSDSSLQVILDALPTTGDATTLSNSLYNKILSRQGVNIVSVTAGGADASVVAVAPAPTPTDVAVVNSPQPLTFDASIAGSADQIRATLVDVEKVIRPMVIRQMYITVSGTQLETNIQGETYYLPHSTVKLGDKSIKP